MASVLKRGKNTYAVVYYIEDKNGKKQQMWETRKTKAEAEKRKKQIEYEQQNGTFIVPKSTTVSELLEQYVSVYGVNTWALSTYNGKLGLIHNYINPLIGDMKLSEITPFVMDRFYQSLLKVKSKSVNNRKPKNEYLSPNLVVQVHKLMRCAFKHAVRWELMTRNPVLEATLPKATHEKREIWTVETLQYALDVCDDDILSLAINLAFSCSLRMGEMLGLTWDCIEIDEESIKNNNASIFVEKELQRVSKEALNKLSKKDVVYIFPGVKPDNKTVLLLKAPKTETSTRKVFLPQTVARMLAKRKAQIEEMKDLYGDEYTDYNLVFCHTSGRPMEGQVINDGLNKLIKEHNLPKVVFHSFRHASITYKLKWNGGDMKSVQGDSGHARMDMIANVYSHIIDEDRKYNAQRFDENFYHSQGVSTKDKKDVSIPDFNTYEVREKKSDFEEEQPIETPQTEKDKDTSDIELFTKLIGNPEALSLLKTLAKSL